MVRRRPSYVAVKVYGPGHVDAQDAKTVQKVYKAEDFGFRLKSGSAAVDRGVVLPNVNEGFTGVAPDLGALEFGRPPPHIGPRR